jgi:TPR repeat protein
VSNHKTAAPSIFLKGKSMKTQMNVFLAKLSRCLAIGLACFALTAGAADPATIRKAAEAGNVEAQFELGTLYLESLYVAMRDTRQKSQSGLFERIFQVEASEADPPMRARVKPDAAEAAKWLRKAVEQGHLDAHALLALLYVEGLGVTKNRKEAARLLRKAAAQGNEVSKLMLRYMVRNFGAEWDAEDTH